MKESNRRTPCLSRLGMLRLGMSRLGMLLGVTGVVLAGPICAHAADGELLKRPWKEVDPGRVRTAIESADDASRVAVIREAADRGYFSEVLRVAPNPDGMSPEWMELLGLIEAGGRLMPRETPQFRRVRPASSIRLPGIESKDRKDLLKGRFRDLSLVNKSTYFDLWSDLSGAQIQPYTDLLNDYYRGLRNRFRADLSGNIDVVLFGNRADYLLSYARSFRESGEHVLGFYVPSLRRLVFYDDPVERDGISLTARHECTHLLVDLSLKGAAVPPWLNEGLACFLAAGGEEASGAYTAGLIRTLQSSLRDDRAMELDDLIDVRQADFEYKHYAWSWSLVHFLNQGDRAKQFQKFFKELREQTGPDTSEKEAHATVRSLFEETYGQDLMLIGNDWIAYLLDDLSLERPDQVLDYGKRALIEARYSDRASNRRRMIEEARECFWSAQQSEDLAIAGEAKMGSLETMVTWASVDGVDLDGAILMMRALIEGLPGVPPLVDEGRKGRIVREVLDVVAVAARIRRPEVGTHDLRAALAKESERAGSGDPRYAAIAVLHDELVEIAFEALAKTLSEDPLHRTAAQEWLYLAFAHVPSRVREVFDYLQLLVDREPDDRNLAALGVAYYALGKEKYGRRLVRDANEGSFQPGVLTIAKELVGVD